MRAVPSPRRRRAEAALWRAAKAEGEGQDEGKRLELPSRVSAIPGIVELGESSGKPEVSQNDYEAQRLPGRKNYPARSPEWRTICSKACKDL